MIRTEGLSKHYGLRSAVTDLNLEVHPGEVYGFLGPNGAGKTTTILMLLGLQAPTCGRAWVLGQPVRGQRLSERRRIGVMGEHQYLYDEMSTNEYLQFFADLYRVPNPRRRIDGLIGVVNLADHLFTRVGALSRGMRQKLSLVRALLPDPDLLILDEPTAGLDPAGIREVRTIIQAERSRDKTIFLSSHILSEVERTADRVGIINQGRLLVQGNLAQVRSLAGDCPTLEIELANVTPPVVASLTALPTVRDVQLDGTKIAVQFHDNAEDERSRRLIVSRAIAGADATILGMCWREMSLEQVFETITEANVSTLAKELERA